MALICKDEVTKESTMIKNIPSIKVSKEDRRVGASFPHSTRGNAKGCRRMVFEVGETNAVYTRRAFMHSHLFSKPLLTVDI